MRYDKNHKADTHKRVVEAAARRFRKDGIEATGVVDLMADAGLTHGGFYAHFSSKETLVREALATASQRSREHLSKQIEKARAEGTEPIEAIIRSYLTLAHRDRPDRGCSVAALGSEIARRPRKTKDAFTEGLCNTLGVIENALPQGAQDRRKTAIAVFSAMIGALQLSRAIADADLSQGALDAGISAALTLAHAGNN